MPQDEKVVVYETPDGEMRVDVRLDQETVWLTQRQMSELFDTTPQNVLLHLRNVFASKELAESATIKDFLIVQTEGGRQVKRQIKHYNLDAIISVGYRVHSKRGVQFRQWATCTLRDHLVRGYTVHQQRLAERGLREARETLDLLDRTLRNQALVDNTAFSGPGRSVSRRSMCWNWLGGWWNNVTSLLGDVNLKPQSSASSNSPNAVPLS